MITFSNKVVDREEWILDRVRQASVLHIGCVGADREGTLHRKLKAVAKECVGIDLVYVEGEDYIRADAQGFDLGRTFDFVVAGEIIEHLWDQRGFFESCLKHLNAGGSLILSTPNAYSAIGVVAAVIKRRVPNYEGHVVLFDSTTLANLVRNYLSVRAAHLMYYEERTEKATLPYTLQRLLGMLVPKLARGILVEIVK